MFEVFLIEHNPSDQIHKIFPTTLTCFSSVNFTPQYKYECFVCSFIVLQIGEEMSQNSFIKQYLATQQELLRQRLEREAQRDEEADGITEHTHTHTHSKIRQ